MGRAAQPAGDVSEESYRKEVCTIAAGIVDQYCVGAPDDRGVTAVQVRKAMTISVARGECGRR